MINFDEEKIVARYGAHPTTGNITFYKEIIRDAQKAVLGEIDIQMNMTDWHGTKVRVITEHRWQQLKEEVNG